MERLVDVFTPVGTASYPHITEPDNFQNKEQYKCDLRLDPSNDGVQAFLDKIDAYVAAGKAEALAELKEDLAGMNTNSQDPKVKKAIKAITSKIEDIDEDYRSPLSAEYDKDTGEATGKYLFKMKSNASFYDKKNKRDVSLAPRLFDANGEMIRGDRPSIKGGSKVSIKTSLSTYNAVFGAGVSARMGDTQIVKLSQGGGGGGDAGFGKVDGGFVQEVEPTFNPQEDSAPDDNCDY